MFSPFMGRDAAPDMDLGAIRHLDDWQPVELRATLGAIT
jgi:hypothetical protein